MFDAPIGEGANLFIWIVCIIGGFLAGLVAIDTRKESDKEEGSSD